MTYAVVFVFVTVAALLGVFSAIRQLQMLQQNSYFASRYIRWYKGAFGFGKAVGIAVAVFGTMFSAFGIIPRVSFSGITLSVVFLLCIAVRAITSVRSERKSIKKLVFTARVKRMFFCLTAILVLFVAFSVLFDGTAGTVLTSVLIFLAAMPEITVLMSLFIMKPVEKAISNYYVNDASRILASMKDIKVIGITGSYGKTSTKFILGRILSEKYNTLVTPENYNTPMGVVITVRRDLKPQTEVFVVEMGAKRKGDIEEICRIVNPLSGVITSVGPQHLDTFGNIETVLSTKFELADCVKKNGGTVFLNTDNTYIKSKADSYVNVSYGTGGCDVIAENITYSPEGLRFTIRKGELSFPVTSCLLGMHNALNITAAAAVGLSMGVTPEQIAFAVSRLKPVAHRLELKKYIGGSTLIDDAYNSNPKGCIEAVRVLGSFEGMKRILVTPGLVELGDREYECNKQLGEEAAKHCDFIILVGKKRSIPIAEGIHLVDSVSDENIRIVSGFAEAVSVFSPMCDENTVLLFENDLPDNYLN